MKFIEKKEQRRDGCPESIYVFNPGEEMDGEECNAYIQALVETDTVKGPLTGYVKRNEDSGYEPFSEGGYYPPEWEEIKVSAASGHIGCDIEMIFKRYEIHLVLKDAGKVTISDEGIIVLMGEIEKCKFFVQGYTFARNNMKKEIEEETGLSYDEVISGAKRSKERKKPTLLN